MDLPPRTAIFFLQIGQVEKVFSSSGFWRCASCLACGVRCPKEIDYGKISEALRQLYLLNNKTEPVVSPDTLDEKILAEAPQQLFIAAFRKYIK